MNIFIIFLLGLIIGSLVAWFFFRRRIAALGREAERLRRELKETEKCGTGIEEFRERQQARKEAAKGEILAALKERGVLKNEEIAELADISSATVVRYMDELEAEGKVSQEGTAGRSVVYRINASAGG